MKEVKYILHAFLLLLAFISVFICLKAIYSINESQTGPVLTDNMLNRPTVSSKGKLLFQAKCASCHILFKNAVGPGLCGFQERGPWTERRNIYLWIKDPAEFMKSNEYTRDLKKAFGGNMMMAFPELSMEDIDEIISYINNACGSPLPNG